MSDDSFWQPERDDYLYKMEEMAKERYIPIVKAEVGQFLQVLIKLKKPERILEIGTAIGYSTIWMARAAGPAIEIVTIELSEEMAVLARDNFLQCGITEQVNLKVGDALEVLPYLKREFDFVFIDAAKGQYLNYLEMILEILPVGGIIVADNVLYSGYVSKKGKIKHKRRTIVNNLREYLETVTHHPLLQSSIIPIGDGIALSVRRKNNEKT